MPKSWKPEWSKEPDNLLKIPAKAHYVIHHLMWKAFPDSISMSRAFWLFSITEKQKVTAKIYDILKRQISDDQSRLRKRLQIICRTKTKSESIDYAEFQNLKVIGKILARQ